MSLSAEQCPMEGRFYYVEENCEDVVHQCVISVFFEKMTSRKSRLPRVIAHWAVNQVVVHQSTTDLESSGDLDRGVEAQGGRLGPCDPALLPPPAK